MNDKSILELNKESWEVSAERFFGRSPLPEYGPFAPSEEQLKLLGDIRGKMVLDIGCGSGHSLLYMGTQGAKELWGLDLTAKQIETANRVLDEKSFHAFLFEAPMETDPGLPANYFDLIYSIYALGWTVDLKQTLSNIHRYLRPGKPFVFSWENPMHDRLVYEGEGFVLKKSYNIEGPEYNEGWNRKVIIHHRKLSTYINSLIETGFTLEKVIDQVVLPEETTSDNPSQWYSPQKAELVPATFIIKARKMTSEGSK